MAAPTLMEYLSRDLLSFHTKRRLFGGPYLRINSFLRVFKDLYIKGAILGSAKRDKLPTLVKIFPVEEGREQEVIETLQKDAKERFERFKSSAEDEVEDFHRIMLLAALDEIGLSFLDAGQKGWEVTNKKISLKEVKNLTEQAGREGVGFGSLFPELTENIYNPEARVTNFVERKQWLLGDVAKYAAEYYPDFLDPLELRSI